MSKQKQSVGNDFNSKLSLIQRKALKYYEKTNDIFKLHFFFEAFEGRNFLGDQPILPNCNSLFISRIPTKQGVFLHKSDEYYKQKEDAQLFIEERIGDDEV